MRRNNRIRLNESSIKNIVRRVVRESVGGSKEVYTSMDKRMFNELLHNADLNKYLSGKYLYGKGLYLFDDWNMGAAYVYRNDYLVKGEIKDVSQARVEPWAHGSTLYVTDPSNFTPTGISTDKGRTWQDITLDQLFETRQRRINESKLHRIIRESIKRVMREGNNAF